MKKQKLSFGKRLKRFFVYNGLNEEDARLVYPKIVESNRVLLAIFSGIALAAMILMLLLGGTTENLSENRILYIAIAVGASVLLLLSLTLCKRSKVVTILCVYGFASLLMAYGIVLGCFLQPQEVTVSFVVLLFAVPLVFTFRAVEMDAITIVAVVTYFCLAPIRQSHEVFVNNLTVVVPYGVISFAVAHVVNANKTARFSYERKATTLAETDVLTGFYNRTHYEHTIRELREKHVGLVIAALDINGLKTANDTLGHAAGDELIVGAASCIEKTFGAYGKCFRTGGDEFIVIVEGLPLDASILRSSLQETLLAWRGEHNDSLSISLGIASVADSKDIDAALLTADREMYREKNDYYANSGKRVRK